jgi:hypothetical protein
LPAGQAATSATLPTVQPYPQACAGLTIMIIMMARDVHTHDARVANQTKLWCSEQHCTIQLLLTSGKLQLSSRQRKVLSTQSLSHGVIIPLNENYVIIIIIIIIKLPDQAMRTMLCASAAWI